MPPSVSADATCDITGALQGLRDGESQPQDAVFPLVYAALREIARAQRRREGGGALTTTALVHEIWLDLAGRDPRQWPDRAHFYAYAGRAMRSILIDEARRRQAQKRGGEAVPEPLDENLPMPTDLGADLLALDAALTHLGALDGALERVVELRYFAGLAVPQVAETLGIAPRSVDRMWQKARGMLAQFLG